MKKLLWLISLLLLVGVVGPSAAIAGSPLNGSAASVFFVQNTSASYSANCTYTIYDANGNVASTQSFTVAPVDRKVVSMADVTGIAAGTRGTGKVHCDQSVAVVSLYSNPPAGGLNSSGAAFEGKGWFSSGTWYAPENYNNYSGYYSEIVVYNTSDSSAAVTIRFYDPSGNQVGTCLNLAVLAHTATAFTPCGSLVANVNYSAVISSNVPVVPVVNWYTLTNPQLGSYLPLPGGYSTVYIPYAMNNYLGFNTALTVMNVGTQSTNITVTYYSSANGAVVGSETQYNIAPNGTALFFTGGRGFDNNWASAVVTNSGGQPLIAIENEGGPNNRAGSFTGIPIGSSQNNYAPNMFYHFSGYNSSITCQNTGWGATDMTIYYSGIVTPTTQTNVQPNQSVVFYDANMFSDPNAFPGGWTGAARVFGNSMPIACVVALDQNDSATYSNANMDQTYVYNAFSNSDTALDAYLPMLFAPTVDSRFAIVADVASAGLADEDRLGLVTGQYASYAGIDEATKIQTIRTKGFLGSGPYPPCVWDEVNEKVYPDQMPPYPTTCADWIRGHPGKEWVIGNEPDNTYGNGGDALCNVYGGGYHCGKYSEMFYNVRQFILAKDSTALIFPASWSSSDKCNDFSTTNGLWVDEYNNGYHDDVLNKDFPRHGSINVNAWNFHSYYFQDDASLTCFVNGLNQKRNELNNQGQSKIVNPIDNVRITELAYDWAYGCTRSPSPSNCLLEIITMQNVIPRLRARADVSRWYWFTSRAELIYGGETPTLTPAGKCYKQLARQPWCFTYISRHGPGTVVDDASVGNTAWVNPSNAMASDNVYATVDLDAGISHYLKATNFGFSIPTDAVINGVVVEVEKHMAPYFVNVVDYSVRLVKGGTISGNDKANPNTWSTTDTYVDYGSPLDTWGLSLTPSDVNSANFGVAFSARAWWAYVGIDGYVDHIRMTVFYSR